MHAEVRVPAGQRDRLERVCRYALRPPVAGARLQLTGDGQVVLQLRHAWADLMRRALGGRPGISRVEVHLSDEDGKKGGQNDKRCMMEARLDGRQPAAGRRIDQCDEPQPTATARARRFEAIDVTSACFRGTLD